MGTLGKPKFWPNPNIIHHNTTLASCWQIHSFSPSRQCSRYNHSIQSQHPNCESLPVQTLRDTMDQADIPALLSRLSSDEDAMRKMAVFKLQSSINDPAFADVFISSGGNTLAYSLQSLSRLLEVDMGWEIFESTGAGELVERVVELIVVHPLVNILRGAMSILVAIVSHPQSSRGAIRIPGAFGFRALNGNGGT